MKHVVVIGAGFSGTVVSYNLIEQTKQPLKVTLIERGTFFGKGLAYSTIDPRHLLNVPTGNMSAFPSRPTDFAEWLKKNGHDANPQGFSSRLAYGEYLQSLMTGTIARCLKQSDRLAFELLKDEVVAVGQNQNGKYQVTTQNGNILECDQVVLALGHFPPGQFADKNQNLTKNSRYIKQFWNSPIWPLIPQDARIAIIGTGLSMVDVVMSLHQRQHRGKIHALSRRGMMPQMHAEKDPTYKLNLPEHHLSPLAMLQFIRTEVQSCEKRKLNWRNVVDGLRPVTNKLWQSWDMKEKRQFLRHLRAYWEVHRHRVAPEVFQVLSSLIKDQQIEVSRVKNLMTDISDHGIHMAYVDRQGTSQKLTVDYVVDCSGTESDFRNINSALMSSLLQKSLISHDDLHMGIKTNSIGQVVDGQSKTNESLYAIGPIRKGLLYETTAVPELRVQALSIAESILNRLESKNE